MDKSVLKAGVFLKYVLLVLHLLAHLGVYLTKLTLKLTASLLDLGALCVKIGKHCLSIGVYLSVAGFIIPSILSMKLGMLATAAAFFLLYIIGDVLCKVVVRYRIYKEVYWITSRTIAALFRVSASDIGKGLVQKLFADNLRRGYSSVIVVLPTWKDQVGIPALTTPVPFAEAVDSRATAKKIANSAETQLYKLLALMSAATMALTVLCVVLSLPLQALPYSEILRPLLTAVLAILGGLFIYRKEKKHYIRSLTDIYAYCFDGKRESFNNAYAKAWFLHGYSE